MHSTEVMILSPESIEQFRVSLSAKGRSALTVKAYTSDLKTFLVETLEDAMPVPMISREEFSDTAQNWLTGNRTKVAAKTTGRRLTSLRAFAKWAGWGDPFTDYSAPPMPPGTPHPLIEGMDGVRRMIAATPDQRYRTCIAICGFAGARVSEALFVRPSHIDYLNMTLMLHGKGEKIRHVPISDELWGIIARSVVEAGPTDSPIVGLKDRAARKQITKIGLDAGLARHVKSHDLRATFATAVNDETGNIRLVQELLGHASVETTQVYTGVKMDAMRAAVSRI